MARKSVGLFPSKTKQLQVALANSSCVWSWVLPIHSRDYEIKCPSSENGIYSQREKSVSPLLSLLSCHPPIAIHRQLRIYLNASNVVFIFHFSILFREESKSCKPVRNTLWYCQELWLQLQGFMLAGGSLVLLLQVTEMLPSPSPWRGDVPLAVHQAVTRGSDYQQTGNCTASQRSLGAVLYGNYIEGYCRLDPKKRAQSSGAQELGEWQCVYHVIAGTFGVCSTLHVTWHRAGKRKYWPKKNWKRYTSS